MKTPPNGRTTSDIFRDRARRTHDEAMSVIEAERKALRKKTERLRAERLARDADMPTPEPVEKPKRKVAAKAKAPAKAPAKVKVKAAAKS